MYKLFTVLVITSSMSITPIFAADTVDPTQIPVPTNVTLPTDPVPPVVETTSAPTTPELNAAPTVPAAPAPAPTAAPAPVPSMGSSLGEYKSVACSTNPAFTTNSCNQCFVGASIKVGDSLTGLFDNWTNTTDNILIAYKDEQKLPNMISFGNTVWTPTPTDLAKFWKNSSDITWVPSGGTGSRMNYILQAGQKVKFLEAELGARYTLDKSDKKDGDMVGLLRFPVVAHAVDKTTANEGPATTHYECVSYTLSAPVAPTPVTPEPTKSTPPTPAEVTQTQTGPAETLILIVAAFFIAFGMMFSLRKRN